MRIIFILMIFIFCHQLNIKAQNVNCEKCDGGVVIAVADNFHKLSLELLVRFLCTFGPECHTNIEYSQDSNEVLFRVLEKYPGAFIKAMESPSLQHEYIYKILSEPLVYENVAFLRKKITRTKGDKKIRQAILDALDQALEK